MVYSVESCYFALSWGLHYLENGCEPQNQEDLSVVLQRNLFKYMNTCTELVRSCRVIEIQEAVSIHRFKKCIHREVKFSCEILNLQAYKAICDLLIIFSDLLGNVNPLFKKLHFVSTLDQQAVLNGFVQQYVFAVQEEGLYTRCLEIRLLEDKSFCGIYLNFSESHDETRIEELHKKRNYLAAYCKLVVYNVIPTKAAADIFKHYLRVRQFKE